MKPYRQTDLERDFTAAAASDDSDGVIRHNENDGVENEVKLKVVGHRFTCEKNIPRARGVGTKRCTSTTFHDFTADLGADGTNTHSGEPHSVFECCACHTIHSFPTSQVEILLPMRNDWRTPGGSVVSPIEGGLWTTLHREYDFNLDAAADAANAKCPHYLDGLTPETDALLVPWTSPTGSVDAWLGAHPAWSTHPARAFWNPPYNPKGAVATWLRRALVQAWQGVFSVGLLPMASSVAWFNELVIPFCEWHTFRGRIAFEDPLAKPGARRTSPKQDNLLVIIDPLSSVVGHTAVRDAVTGEKIWTRP